MIHVLAFLGAGGLAALNTGCSGQAHTRSEGWIHGRFFNILGLFGCISLHGVQACNDAASDDSTATKPPSFLLRFLPSFARSSRRANEANTEGWSEQ